MAVPVRILIIVLLGGVTVATASDGPAGEMARSLERHADVELPTAELPAPWTLGWRSQPGRPGSSQRAPGGASAALGDRAPAARELPGPQLDAALDQANSLGPVRATERAAAAARTAAASTLGKEAIDRAAASAAARRPAMPGTERP